MSKKIGLPAPADTNEVQAEAAPAEVAVEIPPVPGGGSWTWSGTEWISNDPKPADQAEESQPVEE
jgi:hypothetical protein